MKTGFAATNASKHLDFLRAASLAIASARAAVDEVVRESPYGKDLEVLERIQVDLALANADLVQFIEGQTGTRALPEGGA